MNETPEKLDITGEETILRDEEGKFVEGHIGIGGRPKGKTIKERVREWLEERPDDMNAFVEHFIKKNRELTWTMLEGRPPQDLNLGNTKLPFTITIMKDDRTTGTTGTTGEDS